MGDKQKGKQEKEKGENEKRFKVQLNCYLPITYGCPLQLNRIMSRKDLIPAYLKLPLCNMPDCLST